MVVGSLKHSRAIDCLLLLATALLIRFLEAQKHTEGHYWDVCFNPFESSLFKNEFGPENHFCYSICRTYIKTGNNGTFTWSSLIPLFNLKAYTRLQKVNLSMSHQTVVCLVDQMGMDHDSKVKEWQKTLT